MKKYSILILILFCASNLFAQENLKRFTEIIEKNNKEIQAARQFTTAQKINARTGLTPENPVVAYGRFPGKESRYGTVTDFAISQSFDFPTVYFSKQKIASKQEIIYEYEYRKKRQEVLLKSKLVLYECLFLLKNKKNNKVRLENAKRLHESFSLKLQNGSASILEANKAKILYLSMKSRYQMLLRRIDNTIKELTLLNGGFAININDFHYEAEPLLPLDTIKKQIEDQTPTLLLSAHTTELLKLKTRLNKQTRFPEFAIGYSVLDEPDGLYSGFMAEMSIPLWQDKNRLKFAEADYVHGQILSESLKEVYLTEVDKTYANAKDFESILSEYISALSDGSDIVFIEKAFRSGQISIIEYINELSFYYEITDMYLETEKDYYQSLARLYAYRL